MSMGVCAIKSASLPDREEGRRTIAKAIPTKAPTLLTTGVQSAPKSPLASNLTSPASGDALRSLLAAPTFPNFSSHSPSTHGNKLPSATPLTPQNTRYLQSFRGLTMPSTWKRASCLLSWKCRTKSPYNMPIPYNNTLLNANKNTVEVVLRVGGGGTTDFRR